MPRHVWWSRTARRVIDRLPPGERDKFDAIETLIAHRPFPVGGSDVIIRTTFFGREGYRFFNNDFPYAILYEVDDANVDVAILMKAFVS